MVGEVTGQYRFNTANELGDLNGEFKYPKQITVKWRDKPRFFTAVKLLDLSEWLAQRGATALRDYDRGALEEMLKRISLRH
jgi:hypothetical protein